MAQTLGAPPRALTGLPATGSIARVAGFGRGWDGGEVAGCPGEAGTALLLSSGTLSCGRVEPPPLFLLLHHMDALSDFASMRGNRLRYWAPPELGPPGFDDSSYCDADDRCATDWLTADRKRRTVPPARLAELKHLYEAGIHRLDRELGRRLTSRARSNGGDQPAPDAVSSPEERARLRALGYS